MKNKTHQILIVSAVFILFGCSTNPTEPTDNIFNYSFENDLEGWNAKGFDLELGNGFIDWSITKSSDLSTKGPHSAKYYLNNLNDAGKIWLEKEFQLEKNKTYRIKINFDFASAEYGIINIFNLLCYAYADSPRDREDIMKAVQSDTGNGSDTDIGFKWLNKNYTFTHRANDNGKILLLVGVWGIWETARTFYVDNLTIQFEEI